MDEKKAREYISEVCEWLKDGAEGAEVEDVYESIPADLARNFCGELLEAGNVDGQGGCGFCQS